MAIVTFKLMTIAFHKNAGFLRSLEKYGKNVVIFQSGKYFFSVC